MITLTLSAFQSLLHSLPSGRLFFQAGQTYKVPAPIRLAELKASTGVVMESIHWLEFAPKMTADPNGEPPLSPWFLLLALVLALIVLGFAIFGTR